MYYCRFIIRTACRKRLQRREDFWRKWRGGYIRSILAGPDQHLFGEFVEDNDNDSGNGFGAGTRIKRPLPRGTYEVHYTVQHWVFIQCDYIPNSYTRWLINVVAPAGTLHEAFFDPVLDTSASAVGAGGTDGVLKPASFTFEGVGVTTIERIQWGSQSVKMELDPHGRLTGHHMDFIELDGSVGLRLDFDAAASTTTEGGGQALTWGVCEQPWQDGDLLMLRISESDSDLTGATNDSTCPTS